MQRIFQQAYHVQGTLGGDWNIRFTAPCDCTLLHVSAVASGANQAGLTIGDSDDADEYLTKSSVGASNVPAEFDGNDFVDTSGNTHTRYYPRIAAGTVVVIGLDHDYNGGGSATDSTDVTVVLTFAEG